MAWPLGLLRIVLNVCLHGATHRARTTLLKLMHGRVQEDWDHVGAISTTLSITQMQGVFANNRNGIFA